MSCFHVGMSKHSLDGIDIRVMFKLQGGKGVASTMECDMLLDTRCFNLFLQWTGNPRRACQSFEYSLILFTSFSTKRVCLFADGKIIYHMSLALGKVNSPSTPCLCYFSPCEVLDVAQTNTSEYSKEECTFQYLVLTWSLGQHFCFFMCQCLSLDLYIWNALYFGCNVNG